MGWLKSRDFLSLVKIQLVYLFVGILLHHYYCLKVYAWYEYEKYIRYVNIVELYTQFGQIIYNIDTTSLMWLNNSTFLAFFKIILSIFNGKVFYALLYVLTVKLCIAPIFRIAYFQKCTKS